MRIRSLLAARLLDVRRLSARTALVGAAGALAAVACGQSSDSSEGHQAASARRSEAAVAALGAATRIAASDSLMANRLAPTARGFRVGLDGGAQCGDADPKALRAALPAHADERTELGFVDDAALDLRVKLVGARPAALGIDQGRAVYVGVLPDTDRILTASDGSLEELLVLHSENAPHEVAWSVDANAGITRIVEHDGALAFETTGGRTPFTISRPYALDARGERVELHVSWDDARRELHVALPDHALAYPVVVDPIFQTWGWGQVTSATNPGALDDIAMVYDASNTNIVLWSPAAAQTWKWSGTWSVAATPGPKPPASALFMAYDETNGNVVGYSPAGGTTWTWNGTAWTQKTTSQNPGTRSGARMAYDGNSTRVMLFGGSATNVDTWLWSGTDWSKVSVSAPPARSNFGMAWDAERRRLVLFGGSGGSGILNDTWTWNGSAWSQASPVRSPSPRQWHGLTFDTSVRKVITATGFFAGGFIDDVWSWDGTTWEPIDQTANRPAPRSGAGFAHDASRRANVMFGGTSFYTDTWLLYRLGTGCSSNDQCPGAYCTDGVCCNVASCGTCQTCAGTQRGECGYVTNAEDPDTCPVSAGKQCSALGDCKLALGQPAASGDDCASGFVADGVCCNSPCKGKCQACRADAKESGSLSGVCDNARSGVDLHDDCADTDATTCGLDGTCDGRGACRVYPAGTGCGNATCIDNRATGQVCDGLGKCTNTATGIACGFFACSDGAGCKTSCATNAECNSRSHCVAGACVANEGASCDGAHTVVSPDGARHDCTPFQCEGAVCRTRCQSLADCVYPAQCNNAGLCIPFTADAPADTGCQSTRHGVRGPGVFFALVGLAAVRRRYQRRRAESAKPTVAVPRST